MPRRVKELSAVIIICVLTVIGLVCASVGISVLPKCRYGAPDCYFIVEVCAYSDIGHAPPTPNSLPVSADGAGRRVISAADPCPLQTGIPGTSQMTQVKVKDGAKFKPDFCQRVNKMRAIEVGVVVFRPQPRTTTPQLAAASPGADAEQLGVIVAGKLRQLGRATRGSCPRCGALGCPCCRNASQYQLLPSLHQPPRVVQVFARCKHRVSHLGD